MDARIMNAGRRLRRGLRETRTVESAPKGLWASKPAQAGWVLTLALVLCIASLASAMPARSFKSTDKQTQPNVTVTATPSETPAATATPMATATTVPQPTVTPATTSTPSEAQTPLHLSDPISPNGGLTTGAPWWQSALDVTWKLVLVVGLILLAMRLLVALKQRGFAPKIRRGGKENREQRHFFEQIEEIVLAPQHVLHAVRAGDRIVLIARTQGSLRALGEVDLSAGGEAAEAEAVDTSVTFADHLLRWTGRGPQAKAEAAPLALPFDLPELTPTPQVSPSTEALQHEEALVPRPMMEPTQNPTRWRALPSPFATLPVERGNGDATTPTSPGIATFAALPARRAPALFVALPMRQDTIHTTAATLPTEAMSASQEREILWYAETHNDTDTARKYGLTRQRVTAMRLRLEREEAQRLLEAQSREQEREALVAERPATTVAPVATLPRPAAVARRTAPVAPTHPREETASKARSVPQGSAARAAYQQTVQPAASPTGPTPTHAIKPDVATTNPTNGDAEPQAVTVGQILAARFGITVPTTK